MPVDPADLFAQLQRSIGLVPGALLAIVILAGPTTAWLLYRYVVQPRTRRFRHHDDPLLWICSECRSANELRHSRCYRCGLDRAAIAGDLQVLDGEGLVALPIDVAYGWSGMPDDAPAATVPPPAPIGWDAAPPAVSPSPARAQPRTGKPHRLVAVGPGREAAATGDRGSPPVRRAGAEPAAAAAPVPVTPRRRRSAAATTPGSPPADDAR